MATLRKAIQALLQFPDLIFLALFLKALGLLHVHLLPRFKLTPEKCSFDVDLMQNPVIGGGNVCVGSESFHSHGGSSCVIVINAVDSGVAFYNELCLPADRGAIFIML
jgi:hypothetical protein